MHPALWISKTGLDAAQTDVSIVSNNLANAAQWGLKRTEQYLKTYFIRILTNLEDGHRLTRSCHLA